MKFFMPVLLILMAFTAVACITTTLDDGTQIQRLDVEALVTLYPIVDGLLARLDDDGETETDQASSGLDAWVFALLDSNGDGFVSRSEIVQNISLIGRELQKRGVPQ